MEMSKYKQVLDDLYSTIEAKNHDYGGSFEQTIDEFGVVAAAIRLNDKVERLKTLAKGCNAKVNESITDTLRDIAGYSTLALACLAGRMFAKNYVAKTLEDPVLGRIKNSFQNICNRLPVKMALVLDNVIKKEIEAGNIMIDATTSVFTTFDEEDDKICISFTTDKEYPEPMFSIVVIYRWNRQSGTYSYCIKRRTEDSETLLVNGGPNKC